MQLVVVCAGCGAKYTGQSGAKKYKCRTCANIFTFPERPQSPPGGTVLCSNCWNATAINDQLNKCQFCFQKLTTAHSGSAAAAAGATASRAMTAVYPNDNPRPTGRISTPSASRIDTREDITVSGTVPLPSHAIPGATQEAVLDLQRGLEEAMSEFVEPKESRTQAMRRRIDEDARRQQDNKVLELEQRLAVERAEKEKALREIEELEDSHRKLEDRLHESAMRRPSDSGAKYHTPIPEEDADQMRQHEAKIAELSALLSAEKKQREVFGQERDQLKGQLKEIGARFAELNTQLAQEAVMRGNVQRERDQLLDARRDDDSRVVELEASLSGMLAMKEVLEKERDELSKAREQQSEAAELEEILNSERTARHKLELKVAELEAQIAAGGPSELPSQYDTRNMSTDVLELQARVADLKKRLKTEIGAKDSLKRERDEAISRAEAAEYELSTRQAEPAAVPSSNGSGNEHSAEYDQIFENLAEKLKQALTDARKKHRKLCGNQDDSGVLPAEPADSDGDELISSPVEVIEIPDVVPEIAAAAPAAEERLEIVSSGPIDVSRRTPTGSFRAPTAGPPTVLVAPETAVIGLRPGGDSESTAPSESRQPSSRFLGRLLGR